MFELEDVTVSLNRTMALEIDRLVLSAPQTVALIGPNGAGKTTLLRLLAELLAPTSGRVHRGRDHVAYVPQQRQQHRWIPMTVAEVMRMGRYRKRGLTRRLTRQDHECIEHAARQLDLLDLMARSFAELSGGQTQRVLIATALIQEAPCLLLDEPVTGLDISSQHLIREALAAERDRGRLVISATHRLDEAARCDRVLVLNTRVLADGPPDDVLRPEMLDAAFAGRELLS